MCMYAQEVVERLEGGSDCPPLIPHQLRFHCLHVSPGSLRGGSGVFGWLESPCSKSLVFPDDPGVLVHVLPGQLLDEGQGEVLPITTQTS